MRDAVVPIVPVPVYIFKKTSHNSTYILILLLLSLPVATLDLFPL
jgi:hypothetical protein